MFDYLFYSALVVFILGSIYKIATWFTRKIGILGEDITTAQRLQSAFRGIAGIIFSLKILTLLEAVVLDVLLQRRILKESVSRWLAHMLIFYGFMLLLLMHALESVISETIFEEYYSTVNPFFFLRDFFGAMVIAGVILAAVRRYFAKPRRMRSGGMDHYAIMIVAAIMLSGIALVGLKITSHGEFIRMVEDYAGLDDEDEIEALETLWVKEYGIISPTLKAPFDPELLEAGREVHESSCLDCHAPAPYAFTGFAAARLIKPAALWLDEQGGVTLLWYVHIIACFIGLAYLPFSKMFHIFATPISLIANRVMDPDKSLPANVVTRQIMELDACTHCGSCSLG
ncbi:MAG: hypothetical protein PVI96_15520, partial [Desulfobacterales bacterium]